MKRICIILLMSLVMAMTMVAMAYAKPIAITNGSDFVHAVENGEEGYFTQDINATGIDSLHIWDGRTALIDMNGYSLKMGCTGMMEIRGNVALYNGNRVNMYVGNGCRAPGTLAIKDVNSFGLTAREDATTNLLLINVKEKVLQNVIYEPVLITDSKKAITKDQLADMLETEKLPQLESEGYLFTEWKDQSGNTITEWKAEGVKEIKDYWEKDIQITFDTDGGTCDVDSVHPLDSGKLKSIPAAKKEGVCFDGWMTEAGKKVTKDTVFKESQTVKAAWVEEAERAEALAESMDEQGFSQSSIDRHVGMLNKGSTASIFGSGNIWMIIAIIFIAVSAVSGLMLFRRKR